MTPTTFRARLARAHPTASVPDAMIDCVLRACALLDDQGVQATLDRHLGWGPGLRTQALEHPWMREPMPWDRMPRFRAARATLAAQLQAVGLDADELEQPLPPTWAELHVRTYFGGFMPPLGGYFADLAALEADTLDLRLAGPMIHELCHLSPGKRLLLPPPLDEAVAGWLTARCVPEVLWPRPGEDNGMFGAAWAVQVGQALVRAYGRRAVLRCHAGVEPLPCLEAAWTLWETEVVRTAAPHLLGEPSQPRPWLELVEDRAHDIDDTTVVRAGLRAMCLEARVVQGCHRVRRAVPDAPIVVDTEQRCITRPLVPGEQGAPPRWWLPDAVAGRWEQSALVELEDLAALDDVTTCIVSGRPGAGDGYTITPR